MPFFPNKEIWTISQQNITLLWHFSSKLISYFRIFGQKVYPALKFSGKSIPRKMAHPWVPQHSKCPSPQGYFFHNFLVFMLFFMFFIVFPLWLYYFKMKSLMNTSSFESLGLLGALTFLFKNHIS